MTTAELRDRLSQLDPKSPSYTPEFNKRLDAAMHAGGYMSAGNDPFQTAKNLRICERKINAEFEKARAELGCYLSLRERAESLAGPYNPYSGRSPIPRVDPDEWRAELELIRPKFAPEVAPKPEFELPENQGEFRFPAIKLWVERNGQARNEKNLYSHLKKFACDNWLENHELSRDEMIGFLRYLRGKSRSRK